MRFPAALRTMACLSKRSLGAPISLRSHRSLSAVSDGAKEASGKFQIYFRKYGWTFVGTYLGLYVTTLGSVFVALNFDLFSAADFGFDAKVLTAKVVPSLPPSLPLLSVSRIGSGL
jgi:hypothetical protein